VQHWANVNPGSIYSMLATLTKQGLVERTDLTVSESASPVAVYRSTDLGDAELQRMMRDGLTTVHQFERTEFYAAASLMVTVLDRDQIVELLEARIENLRQSCIGLEMTVEQLRSDTSTPPHVGRLVDYGATLMAAEATWLGGFIDEIRTGAVPLLTEPDMDRWKPAASDPAWRMINEREQYLEALKNRS